MTKSDAEFLRGLEEQSRQSEADFMQNIASRLGRSTPKHPPQRTVKGAPEFWNAIEWSEEERIAAFMTKWEQAGAHAKRLGGWAEAEAFVRQLIGETKAKHIIRQDQPELEALGLDGRNDLELTVWQAEGMADSDKDSLLAKAAGADIGIVQAEAAVAHTGSIAVTSSSGRGRTVSLLPTILIAIVPASCIKTRLGEVLRPLDELSQDERPAGVHFISGPSRSSDIENDLTIGVHGPGIVYALVI